MGSKSRSAPHVLALPFPAPGHINPMLSFCSQLTLRGVVVTFVNTSGAQEKINGASGGDGCDEMAGIRFHTIPGPYQASLPPAGHGASGHAEVGRIAAAVESQRDAIEGLIIGSADPVSCIVADSFFPWTQELADKLGIQRILFWTTNAMSFASLTEMRRDIVERRPRLDEDVDGRGDGNIVVGGVTVSASRFRSAVLPASRDPRFIEHFMRRLEGIERAASVVVNSFEELEGASVKAAVCDVPMRLVGPLTGANEARKSGASFFREEERCVDWLDKFGAETVVYVAFGSVAGMGSEEVRELAAGVEASGRPFLWVARDGLPPVPEGFVHRTSARGLVVRWAPQSRVLAHPSVGAFLTHCGWNSTMDAVLAGVPMLCFPLFGDQHLNAMLVDGVWKLGASLLRYDGAPIRAADVEKSIAHVMSPNDGVRECASRWKAIARRALEPAGSSRLAVDSIVADLLKGVMKTESVNALDASFT